MTLPTMEASTGGDGDFALMMKAWRQRRRMSLPDCHPNTLQSRLRVADTGTQYWRYGWAVAYQTTRRLALFLLLLEPYSYAGLGRYHNYPIQ